MTVHIIPRASLLVLVAVLLPRIGVAQETGSLQGKVVDQEGALIVGATVLLDDGRGHKYRAQTDSQGHYQFPSLFPAPYQVTALSNGFDEFNENVDLVEVNSRLLDIRLTITLKEQLEVRAARDNLRVIAIAGAKIDSLPQDSRQLMRHLQRIVNTSGMAEGLTVYVDGFREESRLPPKQDIGSILINIDPFAAEYSEAGKARVEVTTKTATDGFHGEVNFDYNGPWLNARDPFASARAPVQVREYDIVTSGPIRRNRWGYFVDLGRNETDDNAVIRATVLDPITLTAQPFTTSVITPARETTISVRTNYALSRKYHLDLKFGRSNSRRLNQGLEDGFDLPERAATIKSVDNTFRLALSSVFNERWFNELRVELGRVRSTSRALNSQPAIFVLESFNSGGNQESLDVSTTQQNLRFNDNVSRVSGKHVWKTGVLADATHLEDLDRSDFGGSFIFGTDFDRNNRGLPLPGPILITPLESYRRTLLGLPGYRPLQFSINHGDAYVALTQWEAGLFAQDEWRPTSQLTISYGLREEFQTHLSDKLNLAPRLAVAVRPFRKNESTFRAGAGLFYSRLPEQITVDATRFNGTREEELVVQRPPFFSMIPAAIDRASSLALLRQKAGDMSAPYLFLATTSYQQPLPWNLSATISYSWAEGVHLLRTRNINAPLPDNPNLRPQPALGPILQYESSGRSKRHDFGVSIQGDFGARLSFMSNYRLSFDRSDTDSPNSAPANSYDLSTEFGRAQTDQRHRYYFEANAVLPWDVHLVPSINFASGTPFNITTGRDDNGDTLFTDRPAFAQSGAAGAIVTEFGVFNPNPSVGDKIIPRNFGRAPHELSLDLNLSKTFDFGGSADATARSGMRTGRWRRLRDRSYSLSFSVDIYNLLNHTNLSDVVGVISSPLFGHPNSAEKPRRINLGVRFGF